MSRKKRSPKKKPNAVQQAAAKVRQMQQHSAAPAEMPASAHTTLLSDTPATSSTPSVLYSLRVDAKLRADFKACCKQQDTSGSQVLRHYMRSYIEEHDPELRAHAIARGWIKG